jgi:hypothetical protein
MFENSRNVEMLSQATATRQRARVRICGRGPLRVAQASTIRDGATVHLNFWGIA